MSVIIVRKNRKKSFEELYMKTYIQRMHRIMYLIYIFLFRSLRRLSALCQKKNATRPSCCEPEKSSENIGLWRPGLADGYPQTTKGYSWMIRKRGRLAEGREKMTEMNRVRREDVDGEWRLKIP